jgi:protein-tyrosine phosphatase
MSSIIKYSTNAISAFGRIIYDKYFDYIDNESFNADTKRMVKQHSFFKQMTYFFSDPVHIIDNIYLGSAFNAASYYKLKEIYKINIIINVTNEISNYYPEHFIYKNYNLYDINEDSITNFLDESYNFIEQNKDKQILIHCFMGASRSASIVSYYIMKKYNKNLEDTLDYIVEKRNIVNINNTFAEELKKTNINNN